MRRILLAGAAAAAFVVAVPALGRSSDDLAIKLAQAQTPELTLRADEPDKISPSTVPGEKLIADPVEKPGAGKDLRDEGLKKRDAEVERKSAERLSYLQSAQPVVSAQVSAETIIGATVRNLEDKRIGEVEDLELIGAAIKYMIIGRGGFMGVGSTYYRIAPSELRITSDNKTFVLDKTEEQLKLYPKVELKQGRWLAVEPAKGDRTELLPDKGGSEPRSSGPAERNRQTEPSQSKELTK